MDERPVGIVVPMEEETAPYRALLGGLVRLPDTGPWEIWGGTAGQNPVALIVSDAGPVNAAAATERLVARCDPRAVLHGGSAGAHNPELLPGDVVLGARYEIVTPRGVREARVARGMFPKLTRFRRDGGRVFLDGIPADPALLARAEEIARAEVARLGVWAAPGWPASIEARPGLVVTGVVGSADVWTTEPDEVRALWEDWRAECEDMESAYVAQVCALHQVPFVAVRAISDNEAACQIAPHELSPIMAAAGERAARIIVALAATL